MATLYKAGYHMFVRSWENDGDNYNSVTFPVETKEKAMLLKKFFQLFSSSIRQDGIGNIYDDEYEIANANVVLEKFFSENPEFPKIFNVEPSLYELTDMLFEAGLSSEYLTRVASAVEVRYFAHDVEYEIVE